MKLPNGYGTVYKLSGKRRNPYIVKKTVGWHFDEKKSCISLLAEAGVDQTIIKKVAGHSGAMSLTEKVYTHFDVQELVKAINQI